MWFKSPKSTFNTQMYRMGGAVLATTQTTVTYTTIGAEGLESYQPSHDVVQNQNEDHIGFSLDIPTQSVGNGFGFFCSAPNLLQTAASSNAPVVEIKVLRRPSLLQRFLSLKDVFQRRYSSKGLAPTLSPEEADELAARFVHQRSGDPDVVSLDPSFLSRSSDVSFQDPVTGGLTRPIDSSATADNDEDTVTHIALLEYHNDRHHELPDGKESFLPWQEEMMRSDARKREASLLERAMEVQVIEERVRQEEIQARQWVKTINAPQDKKSKLRACGRFARKGMKKIFSSK